VGLSWGFMAKTFASTYFYIGYDDPQVIESADAYPIERLLDIDRNSSGSDDLSDEIFPLEEGSEDTQEGVVETNPQGIISI